jgi:hypothetical protein
MATTSTDARSATAPQRAKRRRRVLTTGRGGLVAGGGQVGKKPRRGETDDLDDMLCLGERARPAVDEVQH